MSMRALIVDDEPLARERLRELLRELPDVQIVEECEDGEQALDAIRRLSPDCVFLDIHLPGLDGFEVLEALKTTPPPQVIFTTAYDEHALRAFSAHAVDYVLKPIDPRRLGEAVAKVRVILRSTEPQAPVNIAEILRAAVGRGFMTRIAVRRSDRMLVLQTKEIDWIEASGNYVLLHVADKSYTIRSTMSSMESELDPARFARIHRQTIVNVDRIVEVSPGFGGDSFVVLRSGTQLEMQRSYAENLRALISRL